MSALLSPVIKEVAALLGLEVRQGMEAFELENSTKLFLEADKLGRDAVKKVEGYQEEAERTRSLVAKVDKYLPLTGLMDRHHAAMGTVDGDTIFLIPESRQNVEILHVSLMFSTPQDMTLCLFPQKWYHSVGTILGLQDIQLGDPELDPLVIVQASDVRKAQLLLSKPTVSRSLVQLYSDSSFEPILNDLSVRCAVWKIPQADDVVRWVKLMQGVSRALREA